jgi:hypothetical protein
MYCCDGFKNCVETAGERGLGIVAYESAPGEIGFMFQSRGIAFVDESRWIAGPDYIDIVINVSTHVGLKFCPFCGRKLKELTQDSPSLFLALAKNQHQLIPNYILSIFDS